MSPTDAGRDATVPLSRPRPKPFDPTIRSIVRAAFVAASLSPLAALAQSPPEVTAIRCGRLLDGTTEVAQANVVVLIEGNLIKAVCPAVTVPQGAQVIDLGDATVLAGIIDCHTNVMVQGDITSADYDVQVLKESIPYRTLRASVSARTALMNGVTTIRDIGTEAAMYADVDLKKAIQNGIVEGPRMFCATRALDVTGAYPLLGYSWELDMPHGVQVCDGADECRRAVREEVMHGADWIKVYADRSYYMGDDGRLHGILTFTDDELKAICDEAHKLRRKVAAHAIGRDGIENALRAGVDTIEHGHGFDDDLQLMAKRRGVTWCPTLFVTEYVAEGRAKEGRPIYGQMIDYQRKAFARGVKAGLRIALGSDAGGIAWDVNQTVELERMVSAGMTPAQAIAAATRVAAELLDQKGKLGEVSVDLGFAHPGRDAEIGPADRRQDALNELRLLARERDLPAIARVI